MGGRCRVCRVLRACVQGDALRLKPWQEPPCVVSEDGLERDHAAQKLVRRMPVVGVSRYDPDPLAALAKGGEA
jgi:hypothetical protein